jgi:hypothetical protein
MVERWSEGQPWPSGRWIVMECEMESIFHCRRADGKSQRFHLNADEKRKLSSGICAED